MNKHKIFPVIIVVAAVMILLPASCSKTGYTIIETAADSSTQIIIANDELNVNYEFDQAVNEALLATTISRIASGDSTGAGTAGGLYNTISKVSIDTSHIVDSSLIRLNYYGKNADQTKGRSGSITVNYALDGNGKIIPWKDPGASITLTFAQYEVVVLATNVSVWMNGNATITNVSGGLLKAPAYISMPPGGLQDKADGHITFTYNDNTANIVTWTWDLTQARTFTMQNSVLTSSITGDTVVSGISSISTSGTNRFSDIFYTGIITPVVQGISSSYLLSQPLTGEKAIHGIKEPLQVIYGVDVHGNPVNSGAPYGYNITWVSNGGQAQTVIAY